MTFEISSFPPVFVYHHCIVPVGRIGIDLCNLPQNLPLEFVYEWRGSLCWPETRTLNILSSGE